jgi:uncharacterized membrane protein
MAILQSAVVLTTFLCTLVAGFLFAFAVVTMPGIRTLDDRNFFLAFQAIDRVIQNNQPIFMAVWLGSILMMIFSAALAIGQVESSGRLLLIIAAFTYMLGVQLPTMVVNIPLNKKLHRVDVDNIATSKQKEAREAFEPRWNRWNAIRTVFACLTSLLLLVSLAKL